jgi:hypothetical protein
MYRRICHGHNSERGVCGECPGVSSTRKRPSVIPKIKKKFKKQKISGSIRNNNDSSVDVDVDVVNDELDEHSNGDNGDGVDGDGDHDDDDNDDNEDDDEVLSAFKFEAVVGFQFDIEAPSDGTSMGKKFIMQTRNEGIGESRRDVYEENQIGVGIMFHDGPVVYPNDMIPSLDRTSLGWDESLVKKSLKATWLVKKVKTSYFGTFESYDKISKKHTVLWDDNNVNSFDVMGRWQEGMLPIIEWRLCEEKEIPTPAIKSLSAREKRAERKKHQVDDGVDDGANVHKKPGSIGFGLGLGLGLEFASI